MRWMVYTMVYLGSFLMIYNIYGFVHFARYVGGLKSWNKGNMILYIPIVLLVFFFLGYLAVAVFGKPDLIVAGILFGGSIFVFVMYKLLNGITQRIVQNERLEAELMAAEESNRTKTTFLASISHEMRTPLNAIIGLDALSLRDETLRPSTRENLQKIEGSAQHLLELIDDVLIINHIESDEMQLTREEFSLRKTLEIVNALIQTRCDEKGIAYDADISQDIGETYIGDAKHLKQILMNILGNAVKYTPEGGSVSFAARQLSSEGDRCTLQFTVRDTGIGIDPDFLSQVFDSFSREDSSTTNRYGGSGLGLTIAKRLTEMMGGDIAVSSEKGRGSKFTITVPMDRPSEATSDAVGEAATLEELLEGARVLVVEDIDLNAEMLEDLLELEGITSERAENGQIAVDMFSRQPTGYYDAILMDLRMPVMDGQDATRAIRALDHPDAKTIPIIALTANTFEEDVRQSLEAGMNAHLPKPVDFDNLYETLGRMIEDRRQEGKADDGDIV